MSPTGSVSLSGTRLGCFYGCRFGLWGWGWVFFFWGGGVVLGVCLVLGGVFLGGEVVVEGGCWLLFC